MGVARVRERLGGWERAGRVSGSGAAHRARRRLGLGGVGLTAPEEAAALWAARLHQSFASKTCFFAALVMQHRGVMHEARNAADDEIDSSPRHGKPKLALARRGASLAAPPAA